MTVQADNQTRCKSAHITETSGIRLCHLSVVPNYRPTPNKTSP